jgi:hypothetical protein
MAVTPGAGFGIAGLFPDPADAAAAGDFVASAHPASTTASATGPPVHLLRAVVLAVAKKGQTPFGHAR